MTGALGSGQKAGPGQGMIEGGQTMREGGQMMREGGQQMRERGQMMRVGPLLQVTRKEWVIERKTGNNKSNNR
jgi:hypothetical protein